MSFGEKKSRALKGIRIIDLNKCFSFSNNALINLELSFRQWCKRLIKKKEFHNGKILQNILKKNLWETVIMRDVKEIQNMQILKNYLLNYTHKTGQITIYA